MPEFHAYAIYAVFGGVILCIAFNLIDMTLAGLLGLSLLTVFGIIDQKDVLNTVLASQGSLALLFGGMVVARVLGPTGIFDHVGTRFLLLTKGSGKRFLLMLAAMVSAICAILPNATAVILIAPIVIRVCRQFKVDFVGPMIFTAMLSNSAGLLTLVGDPATFLVGQAMGLSFMAYLQKVSLGGVMAIAVLIPLMPILLRPIWQTRCVLAGDLRPVPLSGPCSACFPCSLWASWWPSFSSARICLTRSYPPRRRSSAPACALLAIHATRVEPVENVLRDVDWKTIIFIFCMMCYVEEITKTGILGGLSRQMFDLFGDNLLIAGKFFWPASAWLRISCQHPGGGRRHRHDHGLADDVQGGARDRIGHWLYRLAQHHAAGVRRHDVRRHPGRQCHLDRRFGQPGQRGYLCHQRPDLFPSPPFCVMVCRSLSVSWRPRRCMSGYSP